MNKSPHSITSIAFIFCLISFFSAQSYAFDFSKKVATWNLQGASHSTDSKWRNKIALLVSGTDAVDILAIQEAGSPPLSATNTGEPSNFLNPDAVSTPVNEYLWNVGRGETRYIYFADSDTGAHRVNNAIVTNSVPDNVVILRPSSGYANSRPLLGVRFGQEWYFNIHADSNGGNNATNTIRDIHNFVYSRYFNERFFIMGDWNRNPTSLTSQISNTCPWLSDRVHIAHTDGATQISGGNLDYSVYGGTDPTWAFTAFTAILALSSIRGTVTSDHTPVRFMQ